MQAVLSQDTAPPKRLHCPKEIFLLRNAQNVGKFIRERNLSFTGTKGTTLTTWIHCALSAGGRPSEIGFPNGLTEYGPQTQGYNTDVEDVNSL
jgi:hypothetical protein